ncbi:MAG: thymidylate synthase [Candidatus Levybacteria bacterium RIFCSPHIGHO2_02_FULL_39_36]|uniref:Thymidylate synthase n=1 Tax=Candidatus Woesebacteria bacterium GW2011_GWA1_43_12 TaxID=1618557 RepID=A0A0G1F4G3_9BACT|nr:MAG: Thymidylate synthase [Candidatus Woesebacteria bacterium GW2011_GWA1_43_12]OGH25780.1 MAG: thymidylate synthase [Candidatus Levybacteria bacterium RIFCSPHIGHO2_12_FULL_39_39]OGH27468.1 MAG: thymidylate synthase [Candidatus Levybacteria bacterium RIFCSPHIGHO2_02_FULL_39_36]OGH45414.1 MAG: thymidylate synthase [Candidatus Levybacteria bacterium RIFCSPLOWO2_02_FULL_39_26]OGH47006.1 MAG: thymidylate synthase [Candidatus Levybacteria bacterium RIFCSPLOWO2_12_FULL_39_17]
MSKANKHPEYQYLDLGREILKNGIKQVDRGTKVATTSVFGVRHEYDLSESFPLLTTKRVYWNGVLHELYWFFSGQTNIKYLVDRNVHIWDDYPFKKFKIKNQKSKITKEEFIEKIGTNSKFARRWGELPRIYGEMWRKWPTRKKGRTIDQLQWVVDELRQDPNAHNAIVNSWNPEYLYTMATREDASLFPICHNMYQVSNRNGKLTLLLYQRSCDFFLGVPFNIASYALLAVVLARILELKPGKFIHVYGDIHIYENHIEQVKEQLKRKPRPFPTVRIVGKLNKLEDFTPDKVILEDYDPYPPIKAELTVSGGFYQKSSK